MNKGVMNLVIKAIDNATPTLRGVGKGLGGLKKIGATVGNDLKRVAIGLGGLATGLAGFTALAIKAAVEDEAAASKLNATLKARGLATESVTKAIEAQITAGQKLGFTDDEVRAGVEVSTRFTKNYALAQKMQTVAMDLARSSGMTLAEATLVVGKAYQGTGKKALTNLGITKKNVKGQEALNAILNKTRGSALAYSKTTEGAFAALKIGAGEVRESFGDAFRGAITKLFIGLQPYLERFSNYIKAATPTIQKFTDKLVTKFLAKLPGFIASAEEKLPSLFRQFGQFVDSIKDIGKTANSVLGPGGDIRLAITGIGAALGGLRGSIAANLLASGVDPIKAYFISTASAGILEGVIKGMTQALTAQAVTKFFNLFKNVPMTVAPTAPVGAPAGGGLVLPGLGAITTAIGAFGTAVAGTAAATGGAGLFAAFDPNVAGSLTAPCGLLSFLNQSGNTRQTTFGDLQARYAGVSGLTSAEAAYAAQYALARLEGRANDQPQIALDAFNKATRLLYGNVTVNVGGEDVDAIVKDSMGRIISTYGGGR